VIHEKFSKKILGVRRCMVNGTVEVELDVNSRSAKMWSEYSEYLSTGAVCSHWIIKV
jgi:hypothetical protein